VIPNTAVSRPSKTRRYKDLYPHTGVKKRFKIKLNRADLRMRMTDEHLAACLHIVT
jgi:hypothetical protein